MSFQRAAKAGSCVFILCWITGLLAGTVFATMADLDVLAWMRRIPEYSVSIVWLTLVAVIPFLITAHAVLIRKFAALHILTFVIAATYGAVGMLLFFAFGCASWLVFPMLLFSRIIHHCLFCWFVLHCMVSTLHWGMDLVICVLICVITVIIDATLVSPFLAMLM